MTKIKGLPQILAISLTFIIILFVIFIPLGVADGGGMYQTMGKLGLSYLNSPSDEYFSTAFGIENSFSLTNTLSAIVYTMKMVFMSTGALTVSSLAVIYSIILLLAIYLIVKYNSSEAFKITDFVLAGLMILVFADLGYLTFFNTLYTEAPSMVLALLTGGLILYCYAKQNISAVSALLILICTLSFAFIGTVQGWCAVVLGILIFRMAFAFNKNNRLFTIICSVIIVLSSTAFAISYKPADYEKNIYNSVFFGIANYDSVEKLGLDPKLNDLKGKFYTEEIASTYNLKQEFYPKISYSKISLYYISNIKSGFNQAKEVASNAFFLRASYLGNFTNPPKKLANGFNLYSFAKQTFLPNTMFTLSFIFILYFGVVIYLYVTDKKRRPLLELYLAVGIMAAICLKVPSVLTGSFEISRALFMFNVMFDIMLVMSVVGGSRLILERQQNLKNKYGLK